MSMHPLIRSVLAIAFVVVAATPAGLGPADLASAYKAQVFTPSVSDARLATGSPSS